MKNYFYNTLLGVSVLPALFVMPAIADVVTERQVVSSNTTYTDLLAENIASTVANNGGVFYMQDVPNVVLDFNGTTLFSNNSLNNGGMGGAIGNGWLSSVSGTGYTQGGKIVFNGKSMFLDNSTNNANGGGAIFNYGLGNATSPDIIFYDNTTFTGNSVTASANGVYAGGGAINHRNGMIVFNKSANFSENESASQGGAILTAGDMIFNGVAIFDSNSANKNGGALAMMGGNTTFQQSSIFSNNMASGASAIYVAGATEALNFKGIASFTGNTGVGTVLNNAANATVSFANGAVFDSNTNEYNGALVNVGNVSVTGGNLVFSNNVGSNGGGLKNSGTVSVNTVGNVLFDSNTTSSSAGALDNGGQIAFASSNISFLNNTSNSGYGGAVFNAGDLTIAGTRNVFSGNIAKDTGSTKSGGGAFHNRGNSNTASLNIGTAGGTNVFDSNSSMAYGGAIVSRAFDGANQDSVVTISGATRFSNNKSVLDGGAIWNFVSEDNGTLGNAEVVFNGNVVFVNNSAGGMGGALYNNDTVTFNGNSIFKGNTAGGVANDIYNDGTINFNGNTTISGGITGSGTLNIASGTTLNIGSADIIQGSIVLDGTMLATLRSGDTAQLTVNNDGGFTGEGLLKLMFNQAGTYHVFGNQLFGNIDTSNPVYDLTWNGGTVTATTKSVADIASQNNLTDNTANVISGVSDSSSEVLNDLSVVFQEKLASGSAADKLAVEQAGAALNPETKSVTQVAGTAVQNALSSLASERMAMVGYGRSGGDANIDFGGVWAQGLYNKSKLNNVFNGYTRGVSIGIDGTINEDWTLGAGYMFARSDVSSKTRDTNIDSSSIFVYGQYNPSAWYANAVLNYTMSDYKEDGFVFGTGVTSDYDVDVLGARIATGYNFLGGLTPEIAMQYMHLDSSDYTNSLGVKNHIDNVDYLTASLGTKYEFDVYMLSGWILRPQLHYTLKYDLVSDDSNITVAMPGVNAYVLNGTSLSRVANEVGIAVAMNYMGLEISLNYDIESRTDYTSQTGRLKFRYEF